MTSGTRRIGSVRARPDEQNRRRSHSLEYSMPADTASCRVAAAPTVQPGSSVLGMVYCSKSRRLPRLARRREVKGIDNSRLKKDSVDALGWLFPPRTRPRRDS